MIFKENIIPCRDIYTEEYGRSSSDINKIVAQEKEIAFLSASLCAVIRAGEATYKDFLTSLDYKEAGIKYLELANWWNEHQEKDRIRREKEAAEAAKRVAAAKMAAEVKRLKKQALSKLTAEEAAALGIK